MLKSAEEAQRVYIVESEQEKLHIQLNLDGFQLFALRLKPLKL